MSLGWLRYGAAIIFLGGVELGKHKHSKVGWFGLEFFMTDLRKKIVRVLYNERTEKYYQCPRCLNITTETGILDECSNGGSGMCYCEFSNGRILNKYKRISKKKYFEIAGRPVYVPTKRYRR